MNNSKKKKHKDNTASFTPEAVTMLTWTNNMTLQLTLSDPITRRTHAL